VTYRESANFRTPTKIAAFIKATLDSEFEQRNTLPGLDVAMYEYKQPVELQRTLDSRVHELVKAGFKPEDIAIVACRGVQSTALKDVMQVGKYKVSRYTGKYDANNEQIYTDGELTFDTIFRFKGQQAPAVILIDLDESLKRDEWATGILYCAMTRATIRLELVVHENCPWIEIFRDNL
jgi:DNA helicase IV